MKRKNAKWTKREKAMLAEISRLRSALQALADKCAAVGKATEGIFVMAHVHGTPYDGPTYEAELRAAREALLVRTESTMSEDILKGESVQVRTETEVTELQMKLADAEVQIAKLKQSIAAKNRAIHCYLNDSISSKNIVVAMEMQSALYA